MTRAAWCSICIAMFYLVNEPPDDDMHIAGGKGITIDEDAIVRHWGDPQRIYLIIKQDRIPYWQQLLTDALSYLSSGYHFRATRRPDQPVIIRYGQGI